MQSINQEGWSDAEEMGSQDEYQAASPLCKPCLQSPILRADATVAAKELNSLGKGMSVHGADVCPLTGPLTYMGFPCGSDDKESACNTGDPGSITGSGRSPEEERATHSNILAWEIPCTEEPGRLQPMGSQIVRHN